MTTLRTTRETEPVYQRMDALAGKLALAANQASGAESVALNAALAQLYREYWGVRTNKDRRAVVARFESKYWQLR